MTGKTEQLDVLDGGDVRESPHRTCTGQRPEEICGCDWTSGCFGENVAWRAGKAAQTRIRFAQLSSRGRIAYRRVAQNLIDFSCVR